MALPVSGPISLRNVNVELGKSPTARVSLNDTGVRGLAQKSSGLIRISDLRGKSGASPPTITFLSSTGTLRGDGSYRHEEDKTQTITFRVTNGEGAVMSASVHSLGSGLTPAWFSIASLSTSTLVYDMEGSGNYKYYTVRITVTNSAGSSYIDVLKQVREDTS